MQHHQCQHHHTNQIDHLIHLFQHKFISPYKIIYMIDQQEADYFKARNGMGGCCTNTHITIKKEQLSKLEKMVLEAVERGYLLTHLQNILEFCNQRFNNIVEGGRKSNLEINQDVEKYLLDKVLSEGINLYLFKAINQQMQRENNAVKTGLGLWATPATWYHQFPHIPLDSLTSQLLSSLHQQGYGKSDGFIADIYNLKSELELLEKDGRFEQILFPNQKSNENKVLRCENVSSDRKALSETVLRLKSIPFEINAKMNQYCLVSETVYVSYFAKEGKTECQKQNSIEAILLVGSEQQVAMSKNGENMSTNCKEGDLLLIGSDVECYSIVIKKECFLIRFRISIAPKIK